jgi:hypothetical protein
MSSFDIATPKNIEKKANENRRIVFFVYILIGLFFLLLYFSFQRPFDLHN